MKILRSVADARRHLTPIRRQATIGLVPTMGALHDGHVALFRAARGGCGHVVATIFVNPGQFDDRADLAAYPRQETRDVEIAAAAGVDAIFVPTVSEVYPAEDATALHVQGAALGFEGTFRPGHFNSVATVCTKLFNIVGPHLTYFGQKDAQQVAVIRQIIRDLHMNIGLEVVPTVREADGLALSSRNVRLSAEERGRALAVPRALAAALAAHASASDTVAAARRELSGVDIDYVDVAQFDGAPTLVVAVRVGNTRLIDNVPLGEPTLAGLVG
jgi:pantoate--beta-alanine ligase